MQWEEIDLSRFVVAGAPFGGPIGTLSACKSPTCSIAGHSLVFYERSGLPLGSHDSKRATPADRPTRGEGKTQDEDIHERRAPHHFIFGMLASIDTHSQSSASSLHDFHCLTSRRSYRFSPISSIFRSLSEFPNSPSGIIAAWYHLAGQTTSDSAQSSSTCSNSMPHNCLSAQSDVSHVSPACHCPASQRRVGHALHHCRRIGRHVLHGPRTQHIDTCIPLFALICCAHTGKPCFVSHISTICLCIPRVRPRPECTTPGGRRRRGAHLGHRSRRAHQGQVATFYDCRLD
jgi:hypothetical protein